MKLKGYLETPYADMVFAQIIGEPVIDSSERQGTVLTELVREFVDTLPEDEQECFWLFFGEQCSYRETARKMGFKSHWAIQVRVHNIKKKLKRFLNKIEKETDIDTSY